MASAIGMTTNDYVRLEGIAEEFHTAFRIQQDPNETVGGREAADEMMRGVAKAILDLGIGRNISMNAFWLNGPNANIITHLQELGLYPLAQTIEAIGPAVQKGINLGYAFLARKAQAISQPAPQVNVPQPVVQASRPQMPERFVVPIVPNQQRLGIYSELVQGGNGSVQFDDVKHGGGSAGQDAMQPLTQQLSANFGALTSFSSDGFGGSFPEF